MAGPRLPLLLAVGGVLLLEVLPFWGLWEPKGTASALAGLDGRQLHLLGRSLALAATATAGALLVGLPLAAVVAHRPVLFLACVVPFFLPPAIHAMVWSRLPWVQQWPPFCLAAAIFTVAYTPVVILLAGTGLWHLGRETVAAGRLARDRTVVALRLVLPFLTPYLAAAALLVFVFSLGNFAVPDLLGFKVYPVEIFITAAAFYDEAGALGLALPLVTVTLALVLLASWLMAGRPLLPTVAGRWTGKAAPWPARLTAGLVLAVGLGIPVAALLLQGGTSLGTTLVVSAGALGYSLATSLAASVLAVVMALPVAWYTARTDTLWGRLVETVALTPLALPGLVTGLALIRLTNRPALDWFYGSPAFLVLGLAAAHLPFAVKILAGRCRTLAGAQLRAARLARGRPACLGRVVLPLAAPALVTGMLTVFVLCLTNLGLALLLLPPGQETLMLKLYNYLHYGALETVAGMAFVLLAAAALVSATLLAGLRLAGWRT